MQRVGCAGWCQMSSVNTCLGGESQVVLAPFLQLKQVVLCSFFQQIPHVSACQRSEIQADSVLWSLSGATPVIVCLDDASATEQSQEPDSAFATVLLQNPPRPTCLRQHGLAVSKTQNDTRARLWECMGLWSVRHGGPVHIF